MPEKPALTEILLRFLSGPARMGQALFLLGDVFEYWLGDDASLPRYAEVISGLRELRESGTAVYFQLGNRDFMVGAEFADATGATLIPPEYVVTLEGTPTLLLHGDSLCTDDVEHQKFRAVVLNPETQARLRSMPIAQREQLAKMLRGNSAGNVNSYKPEQIMDVNAAAVADALRRHGVQRMIHGHTHRPDRHHFELDGVAAERIVLPDWRETGAALRIEGACLHFTTLR